jgi:hypothetical protein
LSAYHATDEAAGVVESVGRQATKARAVLATSDGDTAVFEAQQLLHAVDEMLGSFPAGNAEDQEAWTAAVALRDELGGYLLAATTLAETGVAPQVVTELLQRGAALAERRLDRLGAIKEARPA